MMTTKETQISDNQISRLMGNHNEESPASSFKADTFKSTFSNIEDEEHKANFLNFYHNQPKTYLQDKLRMTEFSDTQKCDDLDINEHEPAGNIQSEMNVGDFIQKYGNNMIKRAPLGGFANEPEQESSIYDSTFENELSHITESTIFNQLDPFQQQLILRNLSMKSLPGTFDQRTELLNRCASFVVADKNSDEK